jgi:hypothetical protein
MRRRATAFEGARREISSCHRIFELGFVVPQGNAVADFGAGNSGTSPSRSEVMKFLSFSSTRVYEHESLSLWESRALGPGEGLCGRPKSAIY